MHFLRTFVFSAVLWASGTYAATLPIGGCAGGNAVEVNIKIQIPTPEGAGEVGSEISEKLVFNDKHSPEYSHFYNCYFVVCP
jgi:hypothetical protein